MTDVKQAGGPCKFYSPLGIHLAAAWLALASCSASLPSLAQEKLPDGPEVIERYVKATGGQEAYNAVKNRVMKMTMTIVAAKVDLQVTSYQARPNKTYTVVESEVTGKIEKGCTGDLVWENSATTGPQIKVGAERQDMIRESAMDRFAHWRDIYEKAECEGVEEISGWPNYKVVLTPKGGKPQTAWFDKGTGLLSKMAVTVETAGGPVPVESCPSDYRKVGEILIPFTSEITTLGQKRVIKVKSAESNVKLSPDRFDPPPGIKDLLKTNQDLPLKKK